MDRYHVVEIPMEIKVSGIRTISTEIEIGGYMDSDGRPYDMSFQSGFWIENYAAPSDFADVFTDAVYEKKCEARDDS